VEGAIRQLKPSIQNSHTITSYNFNQPIEPYYNLFRFKFKTTEDQTYQSEEHQ